MRHRKSAIAVPVFESEITERSLLGALMLEPSSYPASATLHAGDFCVSSHWLIYQVMRDLVHASLPVDLTTVVQELSTREQLEQVGGSGYVASLLDGVPDNPCLEHYVRVLRETTAMRNLLKIGEDIPRIAKGSNLKTILSIVDSALDKIREVEIEISDACMIARSHNSALDGDSVLNEVASFIRRFVVLNTEQVCVLTLWVAHTHSFEAAEATPYLAITSAEKQCGKTRLLEVLELLVAKPWFTARVTAAVLVRKVDFGSPTLLLDETDAAFNGEKDYAEALRGILNSGYRRGGAASLCVGKGPGIEAKDFRTFCPKALAGIGRLPDTIADRSVPVRLKRRGPRDGHIERFRRRLVEPEAKVVRGKLIAWARHNVKTLREACPELPETLTDRQQDCLEPLLAIADSAGRNWGEWARQSVSQVFAETRTDESSIRVKLLFDIRNVFDGRKVVRLTSHEMVDLLCGIETAQWADFKNGQNLSVNELAKMLRPFDIAPRTIRVGKQTSKGYTRMSFVDSWERYLGPYAKLSVSCPNREPLQPSQPSTLAGFGSNSEASQASLVAS